MEPHGDLWQCAAGHESSHPMARWMCQFIACDHTGSQYIASFDEVSWQKLPPWPHKVKYDKNKPLVGDASLTNSQWVLAFVGINLEF